MSVLMSVLIWFSNTMMFKIITYVEIRIRALIGILLSLNKQFLNCLIVRYNQLQF